jgi:UDPglucose 6-dehydrogenase
MPDVEYTVNAAQVAEGSEALVLATEWPEFRELDWEKIRRAMVHPFLLDGRNFLDPDKLQKLGFRYEAMGRRSG